MVADTDREPALQVVWLEEIVNAAAAGQLRSGPLTFADRVFQNEINYAIRDTRQVGISYRQGYRTQGVGCRHHFQTAFLVTQGKRCCIAEQVLYRQCVVRFEFTVHGNATCHPLTGTTVVTMYPLEQQHVIWCQFMPKAVRILNFDKAVQNALYCRKGTPSSNSNRR